MSDLRWVLVEAPSSWSYANTEVGAYGIQSAGGGKKTLSLPDGTAIVFKSQALAEEFARGDFEERKKQFRIEKFWMVYGVGQRSPTHMHHSSESAATEAKRLSRCNPGIRFVVLEVVDGYRCEVPEPEKALITPPDQSRKRFDAYDDIPF